MKRYIIDQMTQDVRQATCRLGYVTMIKAN